MQEVKCESKRNMPCHRSSHGRWSKEPVKKEVKGRRGIWGEHVDTKEFRDPSG